MGTPVFTYPNTLLFFEPSGKKKSFTIKKDIYVNSMVAPSVCMSLSIVINPPGGGPGLKRKMNGKNYSHCTVMQSQTSSDNRLYLKFDIEFLEKFFH